MKRFLYLFQVEHDLPGHLECVEGADSDIVFLSWRKPSSDSRGVFYPSSSWTQGRNRLLKEVQGCDYEYFIFADDDIRLELTELGARVAAGPPDPWRVFEAFLLAREPAIGCASYDWHLTGGVFDAGQDCQTLRFFDAVLNAYHHEALSTLLPYYDLLDEHSETYSQNLLCSLAADLYPGHVMQSNWVHVVNEERRREYGEFLLSRPENLYLESLRDPERRRRFLRQPVAGAAVHPTMGPPRTKEHSYSVAEPVLEDLYDLDHCLWTRRRELRDLPASDDFFSDDPSSARATRWREIRKPRGESPPPPRFAGLRSSAIARPLRAIWRSHAVRSNLFVRFAVEVVRARGVAPVLHAVRLMRARIRTKALWRAWSQAPGLVYEIPERRQAEAYQLLATALNEIAGERLIFLDVGAGCGDSFDLLRASGVAKPLFSVGIDPIDDRGHRRYSAFVAAAITDGPEGVADFHRYSLSDCSSLKRMIPESVTYDRSEIGLGRYWASTTIHQLEEVLEVPTLNLSTIVAQYGLEDEILHFVKIDAQGSDLDVFRSLGGLTERCLFVQMETIIPAQDGLVTKLYESQTAFPQDRAEVESLGFRLLNVAHFGVTPEADVIFVNTRLFGELLPDLAR